jgi:hypothetical protein
VQKGWAVSAGKVAVSHCRLQLRARRTRAFAPDYEPPPGGKELHKNTAEVPIPEKLAASMVAVVVVHRNLDNSTAQVLKPFHHLHADHAAVAGESSPIEKPAPEQAKIAVHVFHL